MIFVQQLIKDTIAVLESKEAYNITPYKRLVDQESSAEYIIYKVIVDEQERMYATMNTDKGLVAFDPPEDLIALIDEEGTEIKQ